MKRLHRCCYNVFFSQLGFCVKLFQLFLLIEFGNTPMSFSCSGSLVLNIYSVATTEKKTFAQLNILRNTCLVARMGQESCYQYLNTGCLAERGTPS